MRAESGDTTSSPRPSSSGASPGRGEVRARRRNNGFAIDPAEVLRLYNLHAEKPADAVTSFQGVDSWRWQYFEHVACPRSMVVPVDDPTAWRLYPRYRKVYDKLFICESQGIPSGPHGVMPDGFPVFSKPIVNLHGMGAGGRVIRSAIELEASFTPGHMWMALLSGRHVSTDVAVTRGTPRWWRHAVGKPLAGGTFDYWTVLARRLPTLEGYLGKWIRAHLKDFTGIVNFESIGGAVIECHLRMGAEQWIDLLGPGWLASVVELYAHGRWRYADRRRTGYSVALFGPHGRRYWIDPDAVAALRAQPGVSSIQITFNPWKPPEQHAMPPGGFRLAIVNCWDLEVGLAVRERLRRLVKALSENGKIASVKSLAAPAGRHRQ